MGLPVKEATGRLKTGNLGFILEAPLSRLGELARIHPSVPFYAGLLVRDSGAEDAGERSAVLFEVALGGPSPRVREEAAKELILPLLKKQISPDQVLSSLQKRNRPALGSFETSLQGAALYGMGRYGEIAKLYEKERPRNSWDRAFHILAVLAGQGKDGDARAGEAAGTEKKAELLAFLLDTSPDEASRWAFDEGRSWVASPFSESGEAAVTGRLAVSRSAYGEALRRFRLVLERDRELFFTYPVLTGDLGRTFQFAGASEEGLRLFLEWDGELEKKPDQEDKALRYRLLYHAGRMARQLGRHPQGIELFTRALDFAPDNIQKDACIWYILSGSLANKPENAAAQVKALISRWNDDPYFADLLDQLSRYLTTKRQWKTLGEIFSLIRPRNDGASTAKYAWILGRSVEEGYLSPAEAGIILGEKFPDRTEAATAFFRIAFNEGGASFYYRALGASRLKDTVVVSGETPSQSGERVSDNATFLLEFFQWGMAAFVPAYVGIMGENLTILELRALAEAFAKTEEWSESILLVAAYMARPDYELTRRDLELCYPRPFVELIEENAQSTSLPPEIFYGLIRTESAFAPGIVSRAGAIGLCQLMDATARDMAGRIARRGGPDYLEGGTINLIDPAVNLHIGAYYLDYLINQTGSPLLALISYNGGMGRVRRWRAAEAALPEDLFLETIEYPETREYGRRVLAAAAAYGYLYYGMSMEAVVADIFK